MDDGYSWDVFQGAILTSCSRRVSCMTFEKCRDWFVYAEWWGPFNYLAHFYNNCLTHCFSLLQFIFWTSWSRMDHHCHFGLLLSSDFGFCCFPSVSHQCVSSASVYSFLVFLYKFLVRLSPPPPTVITCCVLIRFTCVLFGLLPHACFLSISSQLPLMFSHLCLVQICI